MNANNGSGTSGATTSIAVPSMANISIPALDGMNIPCELNTTHILPTSNLSLQADVEIVEHATILAIQAAGLTHDIFAMFQARAVLTTS